VPSGGAALRIDFGHFRLLGRCRADEHGVCGRRHRNADDAVERGGFVPLARRGLQDPNDGPGSGVDVRQSFRPSLLRHVHQIARDHRPGRRGHRERPVRRSAVAVDRSRRRGCREFPLPPFSVAVHRPTCGRVPGVLRVGVGHTPVAIDRFGVAFRSLRSPVAGSTQKVDTASGAGRDSGDCGPQ